MALERVRKRGKYDVVGLLTTVTDAYDRISMHGVRRTLLEAQAAAIGLPLEIVSIPQDADNHVYEERMGEALERMRARGIGTVVYGDVLLADIRAYREKQMVQVGMRAHFPLWGADTEQLAQQFLADGFEAITVCVDTEALPRRFVGRRLDGAFFAELPASVDPCGENGEFHTFVYAGPIFRHPLAIKKGDSVLRDGRFCYCDVSQE